MKYEINGEIRDTVFRLIETDFESDAAFERALGLPEKTVSNWRRGLSHSYMKMLPVLAEKFNINVAELLAMPVRKSTSELSEDEIALLRCYRKCRALPKAKHAALTESLKRIMELYLASNTAP